MMIDGVQAPHEKPEDGPQRASGLDWDKNPPDTLSNAVHQALGAASTCWESLSGTGVFNDTRARAIGEDLLAFIQSQQGTVANTDVEVCRQCEKREAYPLHFVMDPEAKTSWRCNHCGWVFQGREHA